MILTTFAGKLFFLRHLLNNITLGLNPVKLVVIRLHVIKNYLL